MISVAKRKLYGKLVKSINDVQKPPPSPAENRARVSGMNMIACAKMIGITLAAFTFSGMYCLTPPYCLLPTMRLAYCTGILRTPCTSMMAAAVTATRNNNSSNSRINPPGASISRSYSATSEWGRRAMIPIRMINEIPLPIPLSVIRSPSQSTNMLPPARMIVVGNTQSQKPPGMALPTAP